MCWWSCQNISRAFWDCQMSCVILLGSLCWVEFEIYGLNRLKVFNNSFCSTLVFVYTHRCTWLLSVFARRMRSLSAPWASGRRSGSPSWTTRRVTPPSSAGRPASCCASSSGSSRASGRWAEGSVNGMNQRGLSVSTRSPWRFPAVESRPTASAFRTPSFFCYSALNHKRAANVRSRPPFHLLDTRLRWNPLCVCVWVCAEQYTSVCACGQHCEALVVGACWGLVQRNDCRTNWMCLLFVQEVSVLLVSVKEVEFVRRLTGWDTIEECSHAFTVGSV